MSTNKKGKKEEKKKTRASTSRVRLRKPNHEFETKKRKKEDKRETKRSTIDQYYLEIQK